MNESQCLRKAATLLERTPGWYRGNGRFTCHCIVTAISHVEEEILDVHEAPTWQLEEELAHDLQLTGNLTLAIVRYNDEVAKSKAECVRAMRATAERLEGEGR